MQQKATKLVPVSLASISLYTHDAHDQSMETNYGHNPLPWAYFPGWHNKALLPLGLVLTSLQAELAMAQPMKSSRCVQRNFPFNTESTDKQQWQKENNSIGLP